MIRALLNHLFRDRRPLMDADEIERHQEATRIVLRSEIVMRKAERVIRLLEAQASADTGAIYEGQERRQMERGS